MELNEKIFSLYKRCYPKFQIVNYISAKTSDRPGDQIAKICPKAGGDFTILTIFFKRFRTEINFAEAVI
jgi:hypothetical protein